VRLPLVLFPALALAVAGCGGGGERLTRAEYATQADAICAKYERKTDALDDPSNLADLARLAEVTLPLIDDARAELAELRPPENEQATVDRWLGQFDTFTTDLTEIREKAEANDIGAVREALTKAQGHNTQSNELARQLGMRECADD
jgi:hypothetical protein